MEITSVMLLWCGELCTQQYNVHHIALKYRHKLTLTVNSSLTVKNKQTNKGLVQARFEQVSLS